MMFAAAERLGTVCIHRISCGLNICVKAGDGRHGLSRRTPTDEPWERIEGYRPGGVGTPGRSGVGNRLVVDAISWMAGNAAHWRDRSAGFGKRTGGMPRNPGVWKKISMPWLTRRTSSTS